MKNEILSALTTMMETAYALVTSDPGNAAAHQAAGDAYYVARDFIQTYLIDPVTVTVTPPAAVVVTAVLS